MAKLTCIARTDGDLEVHAPDCRDIKRKLTRGQVNNVFTTVGSTRREVAADVMQDFIAEGSWTEDEAADYVVFLPCALAFLEG